MRFPPCVRPGPDARRRWAASRLVRSLQPGKLPRPLTRREVRACPRRRRRTSMQACWRAAGVASPSTRTFCCRAMTFEMRDERGRAVVEAKEIVVLVGVHVFPHHVAVPIHLAEGGVVAAEHLHALLEWWRRRVWLRVATHGLVGIGPGHQEVPVREQLEQQVARLGECFVEGLTVRCSPAEVGKCDHVTTILVEFDVRRG